MRRAKINKYLNYADFAMVMFFILMIIIFMTSTTIMKDDSVMTIFFLMQLYMFYYFNIVYVGEYLHTLGTLLVRR